MKRRITKIRRMPYNGNCIKCGKTHYGVCPAMTLAEPIFITTHEDYEFKVENNLVTITDMRTGKSIKVSRHILLTALDCFGDTY